VEFSITRRIREGCGDEENMVIDKQELILEVNKLLNPFSYLPDDKIQISDVWHITYTKDKHPLKVRNLCALVSLPQYVESDNEAKGVFTYIRSDILKEYGDAIIWKELEIIFIVLCGSNAFKSFKENDGKAVDESGFTMSSMLGAFFINRDSLECFAHSKWGVYFSAEHFKAINSGLTHWCDQKR